MFTLIMGIPVVPANCASHLCQMFYIHAPLELFKIVLNIIQEVLLWFDSSMLYLMKINYVRCLVLCLKLPHTNIS